MELPRVGATLEEATDAFAVYMPNLNIKGKKWNNWADGMYMSIRQLEARLNKDKETRGFEYKFLSEIKDNKFRDDLLDKHENPYLGVPLLAAPELEIFGDTSKLASTTLDTSIWHDSLVENSPFKINIMGTSEIGTTQVSTSQPSIIHPSSSQVSLTQVSTTTISDSQVSSIQLSAAEIAITKTGLPETSPMQIGSMQIGSVQNSFVEISSTQQGIAQVSSNQGGGMQADSSQIDIAEVNTIKNFAFFNFNSSKIPLTSSTSSTQLLSSYFHTFFPASTNTYKDNRLNLWSTLFDPTNPFDLTFQIQDLPKGQLAEAQITKFDSLGRPIGGIIEVDPTANGMGWFIDPTPFDNSTFRQTLTNTAFRATPDSAAYGHYDLLTALLHEMGHLEGFINGYNGFDHHIQTVNGSKLFVGDNFSATLTPDGSHLDSKLYPYDLMNPTLTPGVRKLPSILDAQIITAARNNTATYVASPDALNAPLTSLPLTDILNGKFDISDTTDPNYGWTTSGAATVLSFEAVLTEDSPLNSEFKQTFTVPQGAKYLQFTLKNTTLGDDSALAPGDAFEVALLDANEKTSLVDTANGLTRTDALLNIQHDGKAYISNKVILPATVAPNTALSLHSPMTFKVDLSGIQPGTTATLYFDRLGFGKRDAKVTIDNVQLLKDLPLPPVANNDTATTDQTKPTIINVFANDTDKHSPIDPKLREVDERRKGDERQTQSNRIHFAKNGFQTFQVDIPNEFRGKIATLEFKVRGEKPIYLDNVFFKSQHLLFGNPALNGEEARKDSIRSGGVLVRKTPVSIFGVCSLLCRRS